MSALLFLSLGFPLVVAALIGAPARLRLPALGMQLAPWAATPALFAALLARTVDPEPIRWLLLDSHLGLDGTGLVFLLLTSALWTGASFYARPYMARDRSRRRFFGFFLLAMVGNFTLVMAQDAVTFYAGFALMSFAAYGIVVHDGTSLAIRAGKSYIVLAMTGELALILGLLLVVRAAGGNLALTDITAAVAAAPERHVAIALLLVGFGVKAGTVPLHVWLPLAHPAAPTPASAVLSGAMIKAGLLGWLRFLPLGEAAFAGWGLLLIVISLIAAFYAVVVGVTEDNPKTVLAYSSISQMGLITVAIGVGFIQPDAWPLALTGMLFYAVHHGLAKGALFLSVGLTQARFTRRWARPLLFAGITTLALALAGAPLTSGAAAKHALKDTAAAGLASHGSGLLVVILSLAAVGTTLLMCRFLVTAWRMSNVEHSQFARPGLWAPLALLVGGVVVLAEAAPYRYPFLVMKEHALSIATLFDGIWPVVAGVTIAIFAWHLSRVLRFGMRPIPAGDIQLVVEWMFQRLISWWGVKRANLWTAPQWVRTKHPHFIKFWDMPATESLEASLTRWRTIGAVLAGMFLVLAALLSMDGNR